MNSSSAGLVDPKILGCTTAYAGFASPLQRNGAEIHGQGVGIVWQRKGIWQRRVSDRALAQKCQSRANDHGPCTKMPKQSRFAPHLHKNAKTEPIRAAPAQKCQNRVNDNGRTCTKMPKQSRFTPHLRKNAKTEPIRAAPAQKCQNRADSRRTCAKMLKESRFGPGSNADATSGGQGFFLG